MNQLIPVNMVTVQIYQICGLKLNLWCLTKCDVSWKESAETAPKWSIIFQFIIYLPTLSDNLTTNRTVTEWVGKAVEGDGGGLTSGTTPEFAWADWGKPRKTSTMIISVNIRNGQLSYVNKSEEISLMPTCSVWHIRDYGVSLRVFLSPSVR